MKPKTFMIGMVILILAGFIIHFVVHNRWDSHYHYQPNLVHGE